MRRTLLIAILGFALGSPLGAAANTGSGEAVRRGDSRTEVETKRGNPQSHDTTYYDNSCRGRLDVYRYAPRNPGDLAQTIYLCDNRVVDIRHSR